MNSKVTSGIRTFDQSRVLFEAKPARHIYVDHVVVFTTGAAHKLPIDESYTSINNYIMWVISSYAEKLDFASVKALCSDGCNGCNGCSGCNGFKKKELEQPEKTRNTNEPLAVRTKMVSAQSGHAHVHTLLGLSVKDIKNIKEGVSTTLNSGHPDILRSCSVSPFKLDIAATLKAIDLALQDQSSSATIGSVLGAFKRILISAFTAAQAQQHLVNTTTIQGLLTAIRARRISLPKLPTVPIHMFNPDGSPAVLKKFADLRDGDLVIYISLTELSESALRQLLTSGDVLTVKSENVKVKQAGAPNHNKGKDKNPSKQGGKRESLAAPLKDLRGCVVVSGSALKAYRDVYIKNMEL